MGNDEGSAGPDVRAGEIASALERVRLAGRQVANDVTLWPLVLPGVAGAAPGGGELWPLDEALDDGFVGVCAERGAGVARVESRAPAPVWVPAGEPVGNAGLAAESRVLPPHASATVRLAAGAVCCRCCRALSAGFRPVDEQVGFVLATQERAVGLELVLPAGLLARRLRRRVEAWARFLLALDGALALDGPGGVVGFDSPEALLAAVSRGGAEAQRRARVSLAAPSVRGGLRFRMRS